MATLPRFIYPQAENLEASDSMLTAKKQRPQIQLDIDAQVREGYRLTVPGRRNSRPVNLRTVSTPPDSPTRMRSSTLGTQNTFAMHDSGALTPPATPTGASHSKSDSASSDFLASLSCLRRGSSISSPSGRPSLDDWLRPGSAELITYPHHLTDYNIQRDGEGRKKPIGVGAWSDVYLATSSLPQPSKEQPPASVMTPPITPAQSRTSSVSGPSIPSIPPLYAIKVPGSKSAKKVLDAEARVLSYLSRFPDSDEHVVPFFGQDVRTGALVLKAMDCTLEDWISNQLNALDETYRAAKLADIFPSIASSLVESLIWMHEKDCIHADIKPSNILVSSSSSALQLVFSDFSSTILPTLSGDAPPPAPLGAGTWEFLDPSLLRSSSPPPPSTTTDLWSLGITLLYLILGTSPFEAFKTNKFQQREMIKSGNPLQCLAYDDTSLKRLRGLSKALGWDVAKWIGKVLIKAQDKRVRMEEWREELRMHKVVSARI